MATKRSSRIPAYPLQWPLTVPRTPRLSQSHPLFKERPWAATLELLRAELRRLGATDEVISTNQPIRQDGEPYAQTRKIEDPGVAVYFNLDGKQLCFPCDRWWTVGENLRAITLHIEAMRAQQRYGVGTAAQASAGYKALPSSTEENWWDVLDLRRDLATRDDIDAAYRSRVVDAHPDRNGGNDAPMTRLNLARDRGRAELAGR